jgi:hypothetical protein
MWIKKGTARSRVIAGVLTAALAIVTTTAMPGALARVPAYPDTTAAATITAETPALRDALSAAHKSAECLPGLGHYNRTEACWSSDFTLNYYLIHKKVGSIKFVLVQSIQLHVIGREFSEHVAITESKVSGITIPAYMSLVVSCGTQCHATSQWHPGTRVEKGAKGTISYQDSVRAGGVDIELTQYKATFRLINGHHANPLKWKSPLNFRCDDALNGQRAGCVFPAFIPILTSMAKLPGIAKNIRRIQNKGPGHYGRPGGGNPLHRLVDEAQQRRNNRIACAKKVTGPRPKGKSCDEYPFASTYEGGHSLPRADRGWAWVPTNQQDRQGGLIRTFYYSNRVLNLDAFYVKV